MGRDNSDRFNWHRRAVAQYNLTYLPRDPNCFHKESLLAGVVRLSYSQPRQTAAGQ